MTISNELGRRRTVSEGGVSDPKEWIRVSHEDCLARLNKKKELLQNGSQSPKTVSVSLSPGETLSRSPPPLGGSDPKVKDVWKKFEATSNGSGLWPRGQKV
jgi:hypothetical protein